MLQSASVRQTTDKTIAINTFSEYFMCPSRKYEAHSRLQQGLKEREEKFKKSEQQMR